MSIVGLISNYEAFEPWHYKGFISRIGPVIFHKKARLLPGFKIWRPLGVSNPCCLDENQVS